MSIGDRVRTMVAGVAEPGGLDATPTDAILREALAIGRRVGAAVHLVHAYLPPTMGLTLTGGAMDLSGVAAVTPGLTGPEAADVAHALEARLRAAVAAEGADGSVTCQVVAGPAYAVLADVAEETGADLVLVGASHRGRVERFFLGTTAGRVLRQSRVPVLVLRGPLPERDPAVLLATDLSELSMAACAAAVGVVRGLFPGGAPRFRCLTVAGFSHGDLPPGGGEGARERAELERFVATLPAAGGPVEPVVRLGVPVDEIAAEAADWGADLVVLGTHGRTGLSHLFLGSVAETAARDVDCGALVIPAVALRGDGSGS